VSLALQSAETAAPATLAAPAVRPAVRRRSQGTGSEPARPHAPAPATAAPATGSWLQQRQAERAARPRARTPTAARRYSSSWPTPSTPDMSSTGIMGRVAHHLCVPSTAAEGCNEPVKLLATGKSSTSLKQVLIHRHAGRDTSLRIGRRSRAALSVGDVMCRNRKAEQTWALSLPTAVWQTMPGGSGTVGAGGGADGADTFSCKHRSRHFSQEDCPQSSRLRSTTGEPCFTSHVKARCLRCSTQQCPAVLHS